MRRAPVIVLVLALIAGTAAVGFAASLGVTSDKIDTFDANLSASTTTTPTVPTPTSSSCSTSAPAAMGAAPAKHYVSTTTKMYSYDHNGSGAFSNPANRDLATGNSSSSGMASTAAFAYVLDAMDKQVYRYPLTYPSSGTTTVTVTPSRALVLTTAAAGGLAVDEANNELWVAEHDTGAKRVWARCFRLDDAFSAGGTLTAVRSFEVNTQSSGNGDAQIARGLALDGTYLYLLTDSKRLYRFTRTSTASHGNIQPGNLSASDTPRGGDLRGTVLFLAADSSKIFRFPDVNAFFTGSSAVSSSPTAPATLGHSNTTGM